MFLYSVTRYFIEMVRGDPRGSFLGSSLSTSQGIGMGLAIASLFMLFFLKKGCRR
jgi:prolipoprotein diacylglyceryltransferase